MVSFGLMSLLVIGKALWSSSGMSAWDRRAAILPLCQIACERLSTKISLVRAVMNLPQAIVVALYFEWQAGIEMFKLVPIAIVLVFCIALQKSYWEITNHRVATSFRARFADIAVASPLALMWLILFFVAMLAVKMAEAMQLWILLLIPATWLVSTVVTRISRLLHRKGWFDYPQAYDRVENDFE